MTKFRPFRAKAKHGIVFPVYQYVDPESSGLNVNPPSAFHSGKRGLPKLTRFAAYYIAHATRNRDFLLSKKSDPTREYVATVLLSLLAEDSTTASETPDHEEPVAKTWGSGSASFEDQYAYYEDLDFWVLAELADSYQETRLHDFAALFQGEMPNYAFVIPEAIPRLIDEWPQVAEEFGLRGEESV